MFIFAYYCNYLYGWHFNNYNNIHNYNNFQATPPTFCDPCLAACAWSVTSGTSLCMHYIYCTKKYAQMQCRRASILADTSPARAWSTWLAPARFHNRSFPEPHTRQAPSQTPPLLEEPTRIGAGTSERVGMCLKHGALAGSHGTHVAQQTLELPALLHYISRDHPNAHELTNHIRHPSPEPGLRSPGAPEKWLRRRCGIVPVSPTGTTGSLPRIYSTGMTYKIGFLWSSSYTIREPIESNQPK